MTRRIAATVLASVAGGVILAAAPTFAAPDARICVIVPDRQEGDILNYCISDYLQGH